MAKYEFKRRDTTFIIEDELNEYLIKNNIRKQFVVNVAKCLKDVPSVVTLKSFNGSFEWYNTPQGHSFWERHEDVFNVNNSDNRAIYLIKSISVEGTESYYVKVDDVVLIETITLDISEAKAYYERVVNNNGFVNIEEIIDCKIK